MIRSHHLVVPKRHEVENEYGGKEDLDRGDATTELPLLVKVLSFARMCLKAHRLMVSVLRSRMLKARAARSRALSGQAAISRGR